MSYGKTYISPTTGFIVWHVLLSDPPAFPSNTVRPFVGNAVSVNSGPKSGTFKNKIDE